MRSKAMRRARLVAGLAAGTLALTGCDTIWSVRVNVRPDGSPSSAGAFAHSISGDGRVVAFGSTDDDLGPGATQALRLPWVRNVATGTTKRVEAQTTPPSGSLSDVVLDGDGDVLVGGVRAEPGYHPLWVDIRNRSLLGIAGDFGGSVVDVSRDGSTAMVDSYGPRAIVWSRTGGATTVDPLPGTQPESNATAHTLSADGSSVSYVVDDSFLGGPRTLRTYNVRTGVATHHAAAVPAGAELAWGEVSDDLKWVLARDTTGTLHVSRFDGTGTPERVSVAPDGSALTATDATISRHGRVVAFLAGGAIYVRDVERDVTRRVTKPTDAPSSIAGLSADGRFLALTSSQPGLAAGDDDDRADAFVVATFGPHVDTVAPGTVAPGGDATLVVRGSGFTTRSTVAVGGSGVTAGPVTYVSPTELRVTVTATADATPSDRDLTVEEPALARDSRGLTGSTSTCRGCLTVG